MKLGLLGQNVCEGNVVLVGILCVVTNFCSNKPINVETVLKALCNVRLVN